MKKYFKFLGIAFMATAFCMGFASCSDKDDNSTSGTGGITPSGYVDLGLPSGTKWKAENETNPNDEHNFYTWDEAMAAFGSQLPTKAQFEELIYNCTCTWNETKLGYDVKGRNGNSIFLPAAGCYSHIEGSVNFVGSFGNCWSSTPVGSGSVWRLYFGSGVVAMSKSLLSDGLSVRLVQDNSVNISNFVDLGLPSGTKWKVANENGFYNYDSAMETFGNQLPTKEQFEELLSICTYTWDGVKRGGYFVSTVNGNSIFLPAAGIRNPNGTNALQDGSIGHYWSSTQKSSVIAWDLYFDSDRVFMYEINPTTNWISVRLVQN